MAEGEGRREIDPPIRNDYSCKVGILAFRKFEIDSPAVAPRTRRSLLGVQLVVDLIAYRSGSES